MQEKENIFLRKLPDWIPRTLKGLFFVVAPLPFLFILYLIITFFGFRGDIQGPDYTSLANIICGGIYLVCLGIGYASMRGSITLSSKHKIIKWITVIIGIGIIFFYFSV